MKSLMNYLGLILVFFTTACGEKGGVSVDTTIFLNVIDPVVGTNISLTSVRSTSLNVNWGAATDDDTATANLEYKLVRATAATAIDTIAEVDAITGANLLEDWTRNLLTRAVTDLSENTLYAFAVLVRDQNGNKSLYLPRTATTALCTAALGYTCNNGSIHAGDFNGRTYYLPPANCQDDSTGGTSATCLGGTDNNTGFLEEWSSVNVLTNATSSTDGASNTSDIVATDTNALVAKYCDDFNYGGFTDWYLPSLDELDYLYTNSGTIGTFNLSALYWTSTEDVASSAFTQDFSDGTQASVTKIGQVHSTRCVRSVP